VTDEPVILWHPVAAPPLGLANRDSSAKWSRGQRPRVRGASFVGTRSHSPARLLAPAPLARQPKAAAHQQHPGVRPQPRAVSIACWCPWPPL